LDPKGISSNSCTLFVYENYTIHFCKQEKKEGFADIGNMLLDGMSKMIW
jgi:hypothetical protein